MEEKIPERTINALKRYVADKIPTGDFLRAVLENNLTEAFARADSENREALWGIVEYVYNELPFNCWGSPEKVSEWLRVKEEVI